MKSQNSPASEAPPVLGIECGATRSVALFVRGPVVRRREGGPANLKLLTDAQLVRHLRALRAVHDNQPPPRAIVIGMAGARTPEDRQRIVAAAARVWPGIPCRAGNDLETGIAAADEARPPALSAGRPGASRSRPNFPELPSSKMPRVLVLSGTGSSCFGRAADGRTLRFGGWGHLLGDRGSGYEIGLRALRALAYQADLRSNWPPLGRRILRALHLNVPEDLIDWAQAAEKNEIAALAVEVFAAARERDRVATAILDEAADHLANDAARCAAQIARHGQPVHFILAGSVLLKQPAFARRVRRLIAARWPAAVVTPLHHEGAWGAVALAREMIRATAEPLPREVAPGPPPATPREPWSLESLRRSPTEQRHPRSMNLDKLPLQRAIALMLDEDARIPAALRAHAASLERVVRCIVRSFRRGGRLFYVGAGTSGRLGVLDASECPPTFSVPPELVQGIIAGGPSALWSSVEGAEDDSAAGAQAVAFRGVTRRDTVVGITASGRTPFVWGALREAKRRGATTVLLCFNPFLKVPGPQRPTIMIAPNIGPEILTGSTRLKAGTATKLVLNLFSTLAMVRWGKVRSNLMVDVDPSNLKLRDRAVRIVRALTPADEATARAALEKSGWVVKTALAWLRRKRAGAARRSSLPR